MRWADRMHFETEEAGLDVAAARHRQDGKTLLDLTVSNPTRCGFTYDAGVLLPPLADPANLAYAAEPLGSFLARQAIAEEYYAPKGIPVSPDRLMLTASTSEAYSYLFRLLCNPGDQVLVPQPSYPLFELLAQLHDVELLHYPLHRHDGWSIDAHACERLVNCRTRAVIVVHPNNPTGHFTTAADRSALYDLACRYDLAVIADEVFLDYALAGKPVSFLQNAVPALTFVLSGLSKVLALPQMKLAWTAVHGPETDCSEALHRLEFIADTFLPVSSPVANAAPQWLNLVEPIQDQVRSRVQNNLAALDAEIAQQALVSRLPLEGGWSVLLRIPAVNSDVEVSRELLDREVVLVHPGSFYGLPSQGFLVVSLLVPEYVFREGIARMVTTVGKLISR